MRSYTDSDMFNIMNNGNSIYSTLSAAVKSIDESCIINKKIQDSLDATARAYRETIVLKAIDAIKSFKIIVVAMPIDKRFPVNMPYVKTKRKGEDCVIVDMSKYATVKRDDDGNVLEASCDVTKLYAVMIPAYIALTVLNSSTVISSETTKWLSYLWAKMFNEILTKERAFVGNSERYEAFMYFAMRFFMRYYLETPEAIVDKISGEFIKNTKSKYIAMIESTLKQKGIDLYANWTSFAYNMFSDEITNIRSITNIEMTTEQYFKLFCQKLGRDGSYLALWSADFFFYCLFVTYNKAYILNDRAWDNVVIQNDKIIPRVLNGLYKEI